MIVLEIIFVASVISIAYQIMIMPGEILQRWARFVNFTFAGSSIQKMLLCPYCFGGQIALWSSIACIVKGYGVECLISIPCTIVLVYFVVKNNFQ